MALLTKRVMSPAHIWRQLGTSLRVRILIPTGVLFALTLTVMVLGAVQLHGTNVERHQADRASLFAEVVANGLTALMRDHGPKNMEVNQFLTVVASHRSEVHSISLLRADGTVTHSSQPELLGTGTGVRPVRDDTFDAFHISGYPKLYAVRRVLSNQSSCAGCHGTGPQVNGALEVRFSPVSVQAAKSHLASVLVATAVPALVVLIAVIAWLLRREVIRPLHRLVSTMHQAAAGDTSVTADCGRPDELGTAARGFDTTLAALRRAQFEVESFYRERMLQADRFATVGELATGLAHEIKNPLAGLSGALQMMAEDAVGPTEQKEVVAEMRHQVERLSHIMESLLNFARPPQPLMRPTDVNATLQKVLFLVQQQRRGPVRIHDELAGSLPLVVADGAQLEQVFLNLCLNAIQAIGLKGGDLYVSTHATETGVSILVRDTGPGIPATIRSNVFRPFFTTKRNGSGLGLAISARIVSDHGGHIDFHCPPSGGTVFQVTLHAFPEAKESAA
jgi:signal transduction histidine kinase